jgi:hypothetical protein
VPSVEAFIVLAQDAQTGIDAALLGGARIFGSKPKKTLARALDGKLDLALALEAVADEKGRGGEAW